jgi:hypothetical protein
MLELYQVPLGEIPIPRFENSLGEVISALEERVRQAIRLRADDSASDLATLEDEIDRLVGNLYGLSDADQIALRDWAKNEFKS